MKVKKLKRLKRAIQNIPSKNIDLSAFITKDGNTLSNSVYCPAAWLTTDVFVGKGLNLDADEIGGMITDKYGNMGFDALSNFFGLSYDDASRLFGHRLAKEKGCGFEKASDKAVFLYRLKQLLKKPNFNYV